MTWKYCLLAAALLLASAAPSSADPFVEEELRIPLQTSGSRGLEAVLVRPSEPGRYPLVLITHGSPRTGADRPNLSPWGMVPQALEFARRGFAAVVVLRRGYGDSDGGWAEEYGSCANPNYSAAGSAGAADLKTAIEFLARRPDIDASRTISVGVSAGGFAVVALTADPPPGLVAAISFAGGRGSLQDDAVCNQGQLVAAFGDFGRRSRTPMLWVYATNDHFFGPNLAQQFKQAFVAGGGRVEFVTAPAFGTDGHGLFSPAGIPAWSGFVDTFLREQNLVPRTTLLPLPGAALAAPKVLGVNGRKAFETYLIEAPHKAFAISAEGRFGWQAGQRTTEAARAGALKYCWQGNNSCEVMFVDDAAVPTNQPGR